MATKTSPLGPLLATKSQPRGPVLVAKSGPGGSLFTHDRTKVEIECLVRCLATMAYVYEACTVCVTTCTFSTGGKFQILWSYTLLLCSYVVLAIHY